MSIEEKDLLGQVEDVLANKEVVTRHSYFQLKYFIVGKEPTMQSKMWQCLRELKTRKDSLIAVNLEIEDTKDKLELLDTKLQKEGLLFCREPNPESVNLAADPEKCRKMWELAIKEKQIEIRRLARQILGVQESLKQLEEKKVWIEQEARFFLQAFVNLEKAEPLKPYDDLESQKEYWNELLSQKLNMKMLLQSPLEVDLVQTIMALPDDSGVKKQIITKLSNVQTQLLKLREEYQKKASEGSS